jgi:hypothetical protein
MAVLCLGVEGVPCNEIVDKPMSRKQGARCPACQEKYNKLQNIGRYERKLRPN